MTCLIALSYLILALKRALPKLKNMLA